MATSLPVIRGPSTALYPFTQQYIFYNTVSVSETANSYRSPFAPPTVKLQLGYNPTVIGDRNTLLSAFCSAEGENALNLQATIDQTYSNLSFDADSFSSTESRPTLYGVGWSLTQWAGAATLQQITTTTSGLTPSTSSVFVASLLGLPPTPFNALLENEEITVNTITPGTLWLSSITRGVGGTTAVSHLSGVALRLAPGNPFPTITGGCLGQYPFTQAPRFQTISSSVGSGPKVTYAEFGAGLNNFPTSALGAWTFEETLLSDADAAVRIGHFIAQWGNLFPFAYTDEPVAVLTAGINSSVTSLAVNSALGFATVAVPFTIQIGSEQMTVTSAPSTTFTVTRGVNGTTAAAQAAKAPVAIVYPNVYYASPVLEVKRNFVNETAIKISLVEMLS